jgi:hypothetical protein
MFGGLTLWLIASILYFGVVVWAGMLWLSIHLLERNNPYNKFLHALVYSAIRIGIDIAVVILSMGFLPSLSMLGAYLVLGVRLLMYHYELSIWKALAVIGLMVAMPYILNEQIFGFVGNSWLRMILVIYGLPTAILLTWVYGMYRSRYAKRPSNLPEARLVTRTPVEEVPQAPVSVPVKAADKAPGTLAALAADPMKVSQPLIPLRSSAPEIEAPAAPSEGPKFLR